MVVRREADNVIASRMMRRGCISATGGGPAGPIAAWFEDNENDVNGDWVGVYGTEGYNIPNAGSSSGIQSLPSWISGWSITGGSRFNATASAGVDTPDGLSKTKWLVFYSTTQSPYPGFINFTVNSGTTQRIVSIYMLKTASSRTLELTLETQAGDVRAAKRSYNQSLFPGVADIDGVWARYYVSNEALRFKVEELGDNPFWMAILFD